jgi:hypothetical protein
MSRRYPFPSPRRQFSLLILLALLNFTLGACKKKKDNLLQVDLWISSAATGLPVQSTIRLEYEYTGSSYADINEIVLGETNPLGQIQIRKDVTHWRKLKLKIYGHGQYSNITSMGLGAIQEVHAGGIQAYNIQLNPNYHYLLSATNANCLDETDSVWISNTATYTPKYLATGCADTIFRFGGSQNNDFSFWSLADTVRFQVIVKRNENTTISHPAFPLTEGSTVPIHINY